MPHKKFRLPYKKERCLLSDVLPYEIPISYSNRHFYSFLLQHRVSIEKDAILWIKGSSALDQIMMLLFSLPENSELLTTETKFIGEKEVNFHKYSLNYGRGAKPERFTTPFCFKVRQKETEFRELSIPHPRSQLLVADFYDRCKEAILYYTSLSAFTIRAPHKITKTRYRQGGPRFESQASESENTEQTDQEYESLKSFFVYKNYSNIHKFYDSYRYLRAEKKYNKLIKLDISKCFDSIYTHSIGWAIIGKESQKAFLNLNKGTFPYQFDQLMRYMNQGETNGIIIGPEFSRIFAEIILQAIDRKVAYRLKDRDRPLNHGSSYEIFRYVDDYFIFVNDDGDSTLIIEELQHALKEYKLYLNTSKAVIYEKPIITEITIAKQQIAHLLEDRIRFSLEKVENESGDMMKKGSIYINSEILITSFKTIIKTCNVEYKDMLNYTLTIVERKCEKIIESYYDVSPEYQLESQLINAIIEIIEFVSFIYSVSPRVNTTIRFCRILRVIISSLEQGNITYNHVHVIKKRIFDDICFVLKKNKATDQTQVETLYLLIALSELGSDYWLEESVLRDYLGIREQVNQDIKYKTNSINKLNYFSITVSLFYMKNKVRYNELRNSIIDDALNRMRRKSKTCRKEAELIFLLFDLISCPYVPNDKKHEALKIFDVNDAAISANIIAFTSGGNRPQLWFTNWYEFDFGKELDAKRSGEVY